MRCQTQYWRGYGQKWAAGSKHLEDSCIGPAITDQFLRTPELKYLQKQHVRLDTPLAVLGLLQPPLAARGVSPIVDGAALA
jgi:hypothetical protein